MFIETFFRSLQGIHQRQELTPADVERINSTRRKQDEQIAALIEKKNEMEGKVWKQEVAIEKRLEELDHTVKDYMRLADKLQLVGANAKIKEINFAVQVNTHASKVDDILPSSFSDTVRPAIIALTEQISQRFVRNSHLLWLVQRNSCTVDCFTARLQPRPKH